MFEKLNTTNIDLLYLLLLDKGIGTFIIDVRRFKMIFEYIPTNLPCPTIFTF